jgi:hypothetical protein
MTRLGRQRSNASESITSEPLSWESQWSDAVLKHKEIVSAPPSYEKSLQVQSSKDVIALSKEAQKVGPTAQKAAEELFLKAVAIAQTHPELVTITSSSINDVPPIISNQVATFLRYAQAIDKSLESLANTCYPAAVLFASVRFMLSLAVTEIALFNAVKEQFEEVNRRLQRLDVYLKMKNPNDAVRVMLRKVMIDILRFCSLSTKYLKCRISEDESLTNSKYYWTLLEGEKST